MNRTCCSIIIVNYRTADLVIDCVRSLEAERAESADFQVIITDNASPDDSVAVLRQAIEKNGWSPWVTLMPLERNGGFAYGNNAAIRKVLEEDPKPEYVMLLNPDTVVRPGAIGALTQFMDEHPQAGIAGSRLEHRDGAAQCSAFRFPGILSEFEGGIRLGMVSRALRRWRVAQPVPVRALQVDWVAGACMVIRRQVFEQVGLMDEAFFMYFEEVDFCRRALQGGWSCWYVPQARVVHLVGQSSGVTASDSSRRPRPGYWFESRSHYFRKHLGFTGKKLADVLWAGGYAAQYPFRKLLGRPAPDPPGLWRDFVRHNFWQRSSSHG